MLYIFISGGKDTKKKKIWTELDIFLSLIWIKLDFFVFAQDSNFAV